MSDAKVSLDEKTSIVARSLDALADAYSGAIANVEGRISKALLTADYLDRAHAALTPEVMARLMKLQGSRLGFKTDKDRNRDGSKGQGYPMEVVRDCFVEALFNGCLPTGNEFNIISAQAYITLEGYDRKLREFPGLTDRVEVPGTPQVVNGRMLCRYGVSWKLNGRHDQLVDAEGKPGIVFTVRHSEYSTPDESIGKARRKAFAAVWRKITGSVHTDDPEDVPAIDSRSEALAALASQAAPSVDVGPGPDVVKAASGEGDLAPGEIRAPQMFDEVQDVKNPPAPKSPASSSRLTVGDLLNELDIAITTAKSAGVLVDLEARIKELAPSIGEENAVKMQAHRLNHLKRLTASHSSSQDPAPEPARAGSRFRRS